MVLKLKKEHLNDIIIFSKENSSVESCGILVGKNLGEEKLVSELYHTKNVLASSFEYMIDPVEQLRIYETAEHEGLEVIAFYHSHLHHGPEWSEKDEIKSKLWVGYSFLIYSLKTNTIKVYTIKKDGPYEDKIKIFV